MRKHSPALVVLAALGAWLGGCRGEPPSAPGASPSGSPAAAQPTTTASPGAARHDDEQDQGRPAPAGTAAAAPTAATGAWPFDADKPDAPPAGFSFGRTGSGKPGSWVVKTDPDAPSKPNVLAQIDADGTDYRFPVAVANEPSLRDVRLSVKCKPVSGRVDQACGLVFRYRDENNYYLVRANALENNVRLYYVKDGTRKQFEGWSGPVAGKAWHHLRVDARGDHFEVHWDGKKVVEGHDRTFPDAGRVGVWTKADSVTYFDDLGATPL
jgi:hypothetical protein